MKRSIKPCAIVFLLTILTFSCQRKETDMEKTLDIQGHRGARGLMPENTIPAFLEALKIGATTLELDLAVTKDKELLVSHEPYINATYCLDSSGNEISKDQEKSFNIYQMSYEEVKSYDCGSKPHVHFPQQQKFKVRKPLLKNVVEAVDEYLKSSDGKKVNYNIEIKSSPSGDDIYHPGPAEFSGLVYDFIQEHLDPEQVNVQSFDFRILQYFHEKYPDITLAVLIGSEEDIDKNLDQLGFTPEIYSCAYKLLTAEKVKYLQKKNMQVIPWTINDSKDMERIIGWGVDGIITDYPDRTMALLKK
ncbi:MAG: glycerophosphodiester phosphodiesterase family protein [Cyclobacteriaceae bacterium]